MTYSTGQIIEGRPFCGKCGLPMTPENSRLFPELFMHDACMPPSSFPIGQIVEDVPAADYHASPGISNSMLKHFARSPRHYQHALTAPHETTPAMEMGTLFHLCVLEPDKFPLAFYVRPEGMLFTTKEGKEWKAAHADLPIITREQHANMLGARDAILNDPMGELLMGLRARNEVSLWVNHVETGLLLKSRFDRLAEDGDGRPWIIDIKSLPSPNPDARKFTRKSRELRYAIQQCVYSDNLVRAGHQAPRFTFIAIELEPPFGVRFVEFGEKTMRKASEIYEAELRSLAQCEKTGEWPGYFAGAGIEIIDDVYEFMP